MNAGNYLFTFCLAMLLISCGSDNNANKTVITTTDTASSSTVLPANERPDTTAMAVQNTKTPEGYYTGTIPCADCEGISQMILLTPDKKYHLEENYIGKNAAPFVTEGNWKITGSKLLIYENGKLIRQYKVEENAIIQLDTRGELIKGQFADMYRLKKQQIGASNKAWMKKKQLGVDFIGVGNEPFWAVDITEAENIVFQRAGEDSVIFQYSAPRKTNGQYQFSLRDGAGSMQITVTNSFCSDGMSDTWYEYSVTLNWNGTEYKGCGVKLNDKF